MITDAQVRRLMKLNQSEDTLSLAAAKAGMDEKTARKYRQAGRLPSQLRVEHTWRTRPDAFEEVWSMLEGMLGINSGLEAKTLFEHLQREHPGRFQDGELRTLQRRVKVWRALKGPAREVFFPQDHEPGELSQSDFTDMGDLGVAIQGHPFKAPGLPFRDDLLELGDGDDLFLREFRIAEYGFAECAVGAGWRAAGAANGLSYRCRAMRHYGLEPRKTNPSSPTRAAVLGWTKS